MPYGRPISSGHGYRRPDYLWSPVLMPFARRRRKSPSSRSRRPSAHAARTTSKGLVESALDGFIDILLNGPRSETGIRLLGSMFLVAVMSLSMTTLALCLIALFCRLEKESISYATDEVIKDYKEKIKAIHINRKTSVNPPPTAEAIRKAWKVSRTSLMGKLLVGTLLSDLEPVVDQSYVRNEDGTIVGRRPGIKGWLLQNCPDMLPHYKAMMNYKALADKLRKALGIEDPDTLAGVLDFGCLDSESGDGGVKSPAAGFQAEMSAKRKSGKDGKMQGKKPQERDESPKSLRFCDGYNLLKSNHQSVKSNINTLFAGGIDETMPRTRADLDAILRERLELVWMRRGRKRPLVA